MGEERRRFAVLDEGARVLKFGTGRERERRIWTEGASQPTSPVSHNMAANEKEIEGEKHHWPT